MPRFDDIQKLPDFDPSAAPGAKQELQRLVVWYDCRSYRRYCMTLIGWTSPVRVHTAFPVAFAKAPWPPIVPKTGVYLPNVPQLQDPRPISRKLYEEEQAKAKHGGWYAEVIHADQDPKVNEFEGVLMEEFAKKLVRDEAGEIVPKTILPPDSIKVRFKYE